MDLQVYGARRELDPSYGRVLVPWSVQGTMTAPVVTRASGSYFYDIDDNRYLDLTSGFVAVSLGHGHPKVVQAIKDQADRMCWVASSYFNDVRARYAAKLSEISPFPKGARAHFTCGGAEANDDAIKIAKLVTRRAKVLTAYRSYHGGTIGGSALTGIDRWRDPFPNMPGFVRFQAPYPYRSPFHTDTPEEECARALDHVRTVLSHEGARSVAAIFIEPMTGSSGLVVYPDGYLAGLRDICDENGILLVYDEVMTGFGRVGAPFAAQRFDVAPHMLTFAKGASSSYTPLGGVLVDEDVAAFFDDQLFDVGHTHAGHVLSVAGGLAALEVYIEEGLFDRAREIEDWLNDGFEKLKQKHAILGDYRGRGALFGLELVKDRETREPLVEWHSPEGSSAMQAYYAGLRARGVHTYGRYNVAMIAPPLTIAREELEEGLSAIDGALADATAAL